MSYVSASLKLTADQAKRLASGEVVRLKHSDLEGDVPVLLTNTQVKKIAKAKEAGKGVQLKFSKKQVIACCSHKIGGGIFSTLLGGAKALFPFLAPVARNLASSLISEHGGKAVDAVANRIANRAGKKVPLQLQPIVDAGIKVGSKFSKDQLDAFSQGLKQGSGLYAPGVRP